MIPEPPPQEREVWRLPRGRTPALRVDAERGTVIVRLGARDWYAFDGAGRVLFVSCWGRRFRHCLDGRLIEQPLAGASPPGTFNGRSSTVLPPGSALLLLAGVYHRLRRNASTLAAAAARTGPWAAVPGGAAAWLDRVLAWDAARLETEGDRFRSVYPRLASPPPDQERAVVLLPSLGCATNRCTFCDLHRDEAYRVRTREEFREHLHHVRAFFGAGLAGRRWLFCGAANALAMPSSVLSHALRDAAGFFPLAPASLQGGNLARWVAARPDAFVGFSGFLDEHTAIRRAGTGLRALRHLGLRRVYLSLETGCRHLREVLGKQGPAETVCEAVLALHAAGIGVGVVVMLGAGGRAYAAQHVRYTARLLGRMDLGTDDFVHFSPLLLGSGTAYRHWASEEAVEPLAPDEVAHQYETLCQAVRRPEGPRVCLYPSDDGLY